MRTKARWLNLPHLTILQPPVTTKQRVVIPRDQTEKGIDDYGGKYFEEGEVLRREWKTPRERSTSGPGSEHGGSELTQSEAEMDCEQRHNSFLPRIINSNIQSKLAEFRIESGNLLRARGFWIDVKAVGVDNFHWIDGSPLAGWFV